MTTPTAPSGLALWGQRKIIALTLLGFASGLPLFLSSRTLQAWMRIEGVDLTTIGLFSLVALPYSLKFLWAPFMDRWVPPFLGRRRGWLIIVQLCLILAIAAMSLQDPRTSLQLLAVNAMFIAFFSASQDVVADAYRTDSLAQREMGAGAAVFVLGYRVALLVTGWLAFVLADQMPWSTVYLALSALMLVGIGATLFAPEPVAVEGAPRTFTEAVVEPFREFVSRSGAAKVFLVLGFIVLFKLPDAITQVMGTPFLLDLGFTQTDIGTIQGAIGIGATIVGTLAGGWLVARVGINRALWITGVLAGLSNLGYYGLALAGAERTYLVTAIAIENICFGLAASPFVAFLMSMCSTRYSATQYALLSSLIGVSRDVLTSPTGGIAEQTGWATFFLVSVFAAVPGLLLLPVFAPWNADGPLLAAPHTGETMDPVKSSG